MGGIGVDVRARESGIGPLSGGWSGSMLGGVICLNVPSWLVSSVSKETQLLSSVFRQVLSSGGREEVISAIRCRHLDTGKERAWPDGARGGRCMPR